MTVPARHPALEELVQRIPALDAMSDPLQSAFELLRVCLENGKKVLTCGNGGSAADADHIAGELMKSFAYRRPMNDADARRVRELFPDAAPQLIAAIETPLPAVALAGQTALVTAFANDVSYDYAFANQVYGLGARGDVLIAISTSGNSAAVLHACRMARIREVAVIGMTGASGGKLTALCDVALRAPARETHLIQELHRPIYHALCLALEQHFFARHGLRA
ncbi:MAG TPA: SIS domain-containing protein [Polyangiales bacterium]|nr:SIS domain-containing protein [Polyangiales bacterium]